MEKVNREPKITEVPLQVEDKSKMNLSGFFKVLISVALIVITSIQLEDYRVGLLMTVIILAIAYYFEKNTILDFLLPSKLIIEGEITWKREYSYIEQHPGRIRLESYAWKYWIYMGSIKFEVGETDFKQYNEGDILRVEKAKRSDLIFDIQLVRRKQINR